MARQQARHISDRWKAWLQACQYNRRMIRKYTNYVSPHGELWVVKMRNHHTRLLTDLQANEPEKYGP